MSEVIRKLELEIETLNRKAEAIEREAEAIEREAEAIEREAKALKGRSLNLSAGCVLASAASFASSHFEVWPLTGALLVTAAVLFAASLRA